jgi:hypothetical protein
VDSGVRHPFLDFRSGGTEVDLGAISPGVIAAFLQQLTARKEPVYRIAHALTQDIRILPV